MQAFINHISIKTTKTACFDCKKSSSIEYNVKCAWCNNCQILCHKCSGELFEACTKFNKLICYKCIKNAEEGERTSVKK